MANDLKSLLLFPEAFTLLVLSKVYLVTKGSLVPLVTVSAARRSGPEISPMVDEPSPAPAEGPVGPVPDEVDHEELANANARLGLLASLTGFAASVPAIVVLKLLGGPWVLRLDMVVFAFGVVVALRLPIGRSVRGRWGEHRPPVGTPAPAADAPAAEPWARDSPLTAFSTRANTHPEVVLALSAMSILRGLVGFLTFLLAFSLRRAGSATWWYGLFLAATVAGAVVGVIARAPGPARVSTEPQMLALSIWSVALAGVLAAVVGGVVVQGLLAFVIGLASAAAKPAFDALVQRYVPTAAQGRAFARFETRLQLVWVLGALLPVVSALPFVAGDVVIAAVAGVSGLSYLTGRRAVRHRWSADRLTAPGGAGPLRRPGTGPTLSPGAAPGRRAARPSSTGRRSPNVA